MKKRVLSFMLALLMLAAVIPAELVGYATEMIESLQGTTGTEVQESAPLDPPTFTLSYVSWGEAEADKQVLVGSGSESDPYLIYSPEALKSFSDLVNGGLEKKIFVELLANINYGGKTWIPTGFIASAPFEGEFDGNGHEIININIEYSAEKKPDNSEYYVGFFGYAKNSVIRNFGIAGYEIDHSYTNDTTIGALVAKSEGSTIENCYAQGRGEASFFTPSDPFSNATKYAGTPPSNLNATNHRGVSVEIDLRSLSSGSLSWYPLISVNRTVRVEGDVSAVRVIGDPKKIYSGLHISVADHERFDLLLELENVNLEGKIYGTSDRTIYVNSVGKKNSIQYSSALDFKKAKVVITGDADLYVSAPISARGADADSATYGVQGNAGANGTQAAYCKSLVVDSDASISITGGNGGQGGAGSIGAPGNNGAYGSGSYVMNTSKPVLTAHSGKIGGTGGMGGIGGTGGIALNTDCVISVFSGALTLRAGNGGTGGTGGQGGTGGMGGQGSDADKGSWLFGAGWGYGENGGTGGTGGTGGQGGTGGAPGSASYPSVSVYGNASFSSLSGITGQGGQGGRGGTGGMGGRGGSCDSVQTGGGCKITSVKCTCGGKGGTGGTGGTGGLGGSGSTGGSGGSAGTAGAGGDHSVSKITCYCVGNSSGGSEGNAGGTGKVSGVTTASTTTKVGNGEQYTCAEYVIRYAKFAFGGIVGILDASSSLKNCASILPLLECEGRDAGLVVAHTDGVLSNLLAVEKDGDGFKKHALDLWCGDGVARENIDLDVALLVPHALYACVDEQGLVFDRGIGSDNTISNERAVYNFLGNTVDVKVPSYVFNGRFIGAVKTIEQYAFAESGIILHSVFLGDLVEAVGDGVLSGCFRLEEIGIGTKLTTIPEYERGEYLFGLDKYKRESVGALKYTVSEGNERFGSDKYGILYEVMSIPFASGEKICPVAVIDAPKNADLSGYKIPEHVALIKPYAFAYNKNLKNVDLSYVMTVDSCAFYQATGLEEVIFSAPSAEDEYVKILEELIKTEQLTVTQIIGERAFYGCTALKMADLSGASVLSIGNDAFADCGSNLGSVTIGSAVLLIGEGAFGTRTGGINATAVGWIEVDEENRNYLSIDGVLYRRLADGTLSLMLYPIAKSESKGSSVRSTVFETPVLDDNGAAVRVSVIEKDAFAYTAYLKEVVLGDEVTTVGTSAFAHSALMRVHIGAGVHTMGTKEESNPHEIFSSCGALEEITVDDENPSFADLEGVLYDKIATDGAAPLVTKLLKYPAARNGSEYVIPETVLDVMPTAFEDADNLKKVTFTSALRSVGENAFVDCSSLSVIYFKGVTAPKFVGQNAFATYDRSLTELLDPRTTIYYDEEAYDGAWADLIEFRSCKYCVNGANGNHNGFHFAPYQDYTVKEGGKGCYALVLVDKKGNPINDVYISLTDQNGVKISKPTIGGTMTVVDQYGEYGVGFDLDFDAQYTLRVVDNRGEYFPIENPAFYLDEETRITYLTLSSVPTVSAVNVSYDVDGSKIKGLLTGVAASAVLGEGKKTVDINSESATINKWCVSSMDVLVSCGLDHDAIVSGYQVLQGDTVILSVFAPTLNESVTNGKRTATFTVTLPTESLLEEEELYLVVNVLDGSGGLTKVQTQLKIKIIELDFKALDFSFLGEGQTLEIDPKLEEIFKGFGKALPLLDKWNVEVAVEIKEDSFRVALGGGSEKKSGIDERPEESLSADDFEDFFKHWSLYRDSVKNKGGVTKTPFSFENEKTVEKRITGFLEVNYKGLTAEGERDFEVASGVTGSIGFTKEFGATYYFVFVPVRLEAELSAEGSISFKLTFDREAEQFITPGIEVQFEGGITLQGGVGFRFASIGLYGSLKMVILVELAPELELKEWTAEGDLGFYVKYDGLFVKWKFTHSFVNGKLYIYKDGEWFTFEGNVNNLSPAQMILNESNYVLATSMGMTGTGLSSSEDEAASSAYEQSSAKSIRVGDKIYIFYYADLYALGYSGEYDSYNYQKLVYQIYDLKEEQLSKVRVLDDNGYADGAFTLSVYEDRVTVLFSQLNERMTAEHAEDLSGYLSATELKAASLDGASVTVFEPLTANGYYEMFPNLGVCGGQTIAVWAENRENTLFGTTENKSIALYKSIFDGVSWSEPVCIREEIGSITDLAFCGDRIGYITDDNDDLATVGDMGTEGYDDRRIHVVDLEGEVLSVSEKADSYHDLSVMNGDLVYYREGAVYTEQGLLVTCDSSLPENYTILHDEQGRAKAILYALNDETKNASDLYGIFYDVKTATWADPVRITDSPKNHFITSFDAVDLGDRLYLSATVKCSDGQGEPFYILEKRELSYPDRVIIEKVVIDEDKTVLFNEVGKANLLLKVQNQGCGALTSLPVRVMKDDLCLYDQPSIVFYDEEGSVLKNGIPSGKSGYVKIYFDEPLVEWCDYTVLAGESTHSLRVWYSDLQVFGKQVVIGKDRYIALRVHNGGLLQASETMLEVSFDGLSQSYSVDALKSGEDCYLQIPIDGGVKEVCLKVVTENDANEENDSAVILLSAIADEDQSVDLKQILESTELRVDLLDPTEIRIPIDPTYCLEAIEIGNDRYDASSGLFAVEGSVLVINGAFIASSRLQGCYTVRYLLKDQEGTSVIAEGTLLVYTSYQRGDINGDGTVSISDVTALLSYLSCSDSGKLEMIENGKVIVSLLNVDEQGGVSISDVTVLLNIISGVI